MTLPTLMLAPRPPSAPQTLPPSGPDVDRAVDLCLDAQALRSRLAPHFADGIAAVRVTRAWRSTSRTRHPHPLVFCCEIDLRGATAPQRWFGRVHRHGVPGGAGPGAPVLHVPELALLLWPWPLDPGLPQLGRLLDPAAAQAHWGRAASHVETLRYEPGRRALLRYRHGDGRVLYAKTYADGRAPQVAGRFEWMWQAAQADARVARVARPLPTRDDHTLWQPAVSGTPLVRRLQAPDDRAWAGALGRALAMLHAAPAALAGPSPRSLGHWQKEVLRRRDKIGRACPELAPQADAVAQAIGHAADRLPDTPAGVIHGDFHPEQAWVDDDGRIVLFDFDEFALGDPMEDLAEFLVKLPEVPDAAAIASACLGAYADAAPDRFCRARLAWHLAVQQLLQASRAFVYQVPHWRGQVRARLDRAQRLATGLDAAVTR